jgi:hypothetical protein
MFGVSHELCKSTDAVTEISPRDQQVRRMRKVDSGSDRRCGKLPILEFSLIGRKRTGVAMILTVGEGGRLETSPHCEEPEDFVTFR